MEYEMPVDEPSRADGSLLLGRRSRVVPTYVRANRDERSARHAEQKALLIPEEEI